jgi:drug/metabolite transporter (DMT)-like permease
VRTSPRDLALLTVAVLAVSTSGPLIASAAVPALAIAFWRNAMAGAVLLPWTLVRRRKELTGLTSRERRLALVSGVWLALHFGAWIPSLDYTSVASSTALVATQPVWAALIGRWRGERVSRATWWGIVACLGGVVLLTGADVSLSAEALFGDVLALFGGLFAALYMTTGSEVRRSVSTTTYTALCYSTTAVLLVVVCLVGRQELAGYERADWVRLVAMTVGPQLLGHSVFNVVLRTTSPTLVSMSILFEIPGAALIAALFLAGQEIPLLALPAGALLLVGLAIVIRDGQRESAPVE